MITKYFMIIDKFDYNHPESCLCKSTVKKQEN